jgi:hypothetical protein
MYERTIHFQAVEGMSSASLCNAAFFSRDETDEPVDCESCLAIVKAVQSAAKYKP